MIEHFSVHSSKRSLENQETLANCFHKSDKLTLPTGRIGLQEFPANCIAITDKTA